MEEKINETVKVDIVSGARAVDEFMVADVVVFSTFSWLFLLANFGLLGNDFVFTLGVLQVCLAPMFFVGARERIKYDKFWGNMNFCFVFYFGVLGGVTNILAGLGFALSGTVLAIPNVFIGLIMILCTAGVKHNPWTFFAIWIGAGFGVFFLGLAGLGVAPAVLNPLGGVFLGVVAVCGSYAIIKFLHQFAGIELSLGKPLFK